MNERYVGTTSLGIHVRRTSLQEVVSALAEVVEVDPRSCVTRQVGGGSWHVYANQLLLDQDAMWDEGILWFARVAVEVDARSAP